MTKLISFYLDLKTVLLSGAAANKTTTFAITDTKLYDSMVT